VEIDKSACFGWLYRVPLLVRDRWASERLSAPAAVGLATAQGSKPIESTRERADETLVRGSAPPTATQWRPRINASMTS
jgi:hypothetical protein